MKLMRRNWLSILILCMPAAGCSVLSDAKEPAAVKLVGELPAAGQCEFIAQAVGIGSGGLFGEASGREDAEENLKEIAEVRAGNVVQIVQKQSRVLSDDGDALETILTGHVYRCL